MIVEEPSPLAFLLPVTCLAACALIAVRCAVLVHQAIKEVMETQFPGGTK